MINSILKNYFCAVIQTGFNYNIHWGDDHFLSSEIFDLFPRSEVFRIDFENPMIKIPQIMISLIELDWQYGYLINWNIEIQDIDKQDFLTKLRLMIIISTKQFNSVGYQTVKQTS